MKCTECKETVYHTEVVYDRKTFNILCRECNPAGIPLANIEGYAREYMPELANMIGKAYSTRMNFDTLVFFLKFATKEGTKSISDTFQRMLEIIESSGKYDDVELEGIPFSKSRFKQPEVSPFLTRRDIEKKELSITIPEIENEEDEDEEEEEVFTL